MAKQDTGVFAGMGLDHLRLHVVDLARTARWLSTLGLTVHATASAPHGALLAAAGRGDIRLVLDQPAAGHGSGAAYVREHGDGVADIALRVADAGHAFREAVSRGATPLAAPVAHDGVVTATIAGFGDVAHTFVERRTGADPRPLPGLPPVAAPSSDADAGLVTVDHLAVCVPGGDMDRVAEFYQDTLDFETSFHERIAIGNQAVRTRAVRSRSGAVTLTLIEPDTTCDPGQIDTFLRDHGGAGVQHIAFGTRNIVETVARLGRDGVRFLDTPPAYYGSLPGRLTPIRHLVAELEHLDILADLDHDGQLFQIFTESVHERNTLFLEIIERQGARTFGGGNVTALYESVRSHRVGEDPVDDLVDSLVDGLAER